MSKRANQAKDEQSKSGFQADGVVRLGDCPLWDFKRARQRSDMEAEQAGRLSFDQLSWFSGGRARRAELVNSPY